VARRIWDGRWEIGRRKAMTVTEPGEEWYQHSGVGNIDEDIRNTQNNWTVHLWVVDVKSDPGGAGVDNLVDVTLNGWAVRRVRAAAILSPAIECNSLAQDDGLEVDAGFEHPVLG
jgi:hypothetical protein